MDEARITLERVLCFFKCVLPKIDYGASPFDADAIALLNEVPGEVERLLAKWAEDGNTGGGDV